MCLSMRRPPRATRRADRFSCPPFFRSCACRWRAGEPAGLTHPFPPPPEDTTMLDWNDYRDELKTRIGEVGKLSPDTVRGYATLSNAGTNTGHLAATTRDLLPRAAAVTTRCVGSIRVHPPSALKHLALPHQTAPSLSLPDPPH